MPVIACERESSALQERHDRLSSWLALALELPALADDGAGLETVCGRLAERLASTLGVQSVRFFHELSAPPRLHRIGNDPAPAEPAELGPGACALLASERAGACEDLKRAGARELSAAVALERFLWLRISVEGSFQILLAAGFDHERSAASPAFDPADAEHFANTGRQLELVFRHLGLVEELERDRRLLRDFNLDLERRVAERTAALLAANRDLESAISALKSKDLKIANDLHEARLFQRQILPQLLPGGDPEVLALYRPLEQVGGDIYDVEELAPGHVRIFIGDATGHGVQAAMRTILLKREYDRLKWAHAEPGPLLEELNSRLVTLFPAGDIMCTAVCFDVISQPEPQLVYANAANPPILVFSGPEVREVYCGGSFLGIDDNVRVDCVRQSLAPGSLVLACSDGFSEQIGRTGASFEVVLEMQGLSRPGPLADHLAELEREFDAFRGDVPLADDVTVVAVRLSA